MLYGDGFDAFGSEAWADGSVHGGWRAVYNGYGVTSVESDGGNSVLSQSPQASTSSGETHASLVVTNQSFGDAQVRVRVKTVEQLRTSAPNPWEAAWVLWRYADSTRFYYFVPKPNGWELGKEDPAYPGAQRFLATGQQPFATGRWYDVQVRHVGNTITVWVDGQQLVTFTDTERPYASGSVGLYNEDAHVHFDDVHVSAA